MTFRTEKSMSITIRKNCEFERRDAWDVQDFRSYEYHGGGH